MKNARISLSRSLAAGCGVAALAALAASAPAASGAALTVPRSEPAVITPQTAPAAAPASPAPSVAATAPAAEPGPGTAPRSAPDAGATPAAGSSYDPEDDARHSFAGTPDFYQRHPAQAVIDGLPMVEPLADQMAEIVANKDVILAEAGDDPVAYSRALMTIAHAEETLGYINGWTPVLSDNTEAAARARFAMTPDFYQRNPVEAIFSALPTMDQVTTLVEERRATLASIDPNDDPEAYFAALGALVDAERIAGGVEEAQAAQGQLDTQAMLGYSEVGDRECPYANWSETNYEVEDPHATGACN